MLTVLGTLIAAFIGDRYITDYFIVTLPLGGIALILALFARSGTAIAAALVTAAAPFFFLPLSHMIAFLLYIVSFGHITP
ncbi:MULTISPECIES: hypothetical protein [unclassified Corynebacterium]|uniref:hypothetical protein n=1 Tax=unclassified Corynebacterium TaxID=2624378 RepID=UPI0029C9F838|nr:MULTISPECIES: hypothetical protein [unclassified Corynebacterium]WPF65661.1 hypothetical protein OLX12_08805 [Corynebacterium sp. 22KM0430]WPF68157.1 hypothetical protein OLW90_08800 [Corynebacterium sp. 21KM1197]